MLCRRPANEETRGAHLSEDEAGGGGAAIGAFKPTPSRVCSSVHLRGQ